MLNRGAYASVIGLDFDYGSVEITGTGFWRGRTVRDLPQDDDVLLLVGRSKPPTKLSSEPIEKGALATRRFFVEMPPAPMLVEQVQPELDGGPAPCSRPGGFLCALIRPGMEIAEAERADDKSAGAAIRTWSVAALR